MDPNALPVRGMDHGGSPRTHDVDHNHGPGQRGRSSDRHGTSSRSRGFDPLLRIPPGGIVSCMNSHVEHAWEQLTSVVKDPVCGMDVEPATSEHRLEHDGQTYYFCSGHCRASFEASPEAYLSPRADSTPDPARPPGRRRAVARHAGGRGCPARSPSGRVPCIRRSGVRDRARAPSVGWPSNRSR